MIKYLKMKKKEHELKLLLYSSIQDFVEDKSDIIETIKNIYISCKDTPVEELQNKLIKEIAQIAHDEVEKSHE